MCAVSRFSTKRWLSSGQNFRSHRARSIFFNGRSDFCLFFHSTCLELGPLTKPVARVRRSGMLVCSDTAIMNGWWSANFGGAVFKLELSKILYMKFTPNILIFYLFSHDFFINLTMKAGIVRKKTLHLVTPSVYVNTARRTYIEKSHFFFMLKFYHHLKILVSPPCIIFTPTSLW